MALTELRDATAVDDFLSRPTPVLLLIGSGGRDEQPDAVLAFLCALGPAPNVARAHPYGGAADRQVRQLLSHLPHTDRACLVLIQGSVILDVLRSTDVEAHGARWATARFAERFLTRLADS
ncbi:hypothetical protein AB0D54_24105 [Streptomyces xanthophaeus]|uniref:hypothetical protein n=1 Tax=Streptomyces xanthophaeus TaxID=67385 RepID=UPI00342AE8A0